MKRLLTIACFAVLCLFITQFAIAECVSTYELTADTQITTKRGSLCAITVITDGTNNVTVILYDVGSSADIAVTNKLMEITVKGADNYGGRIFDSGNNVQFTEGVYADITNAGGGAGSFIVETK